MPDLDLSLAIAHHLAVFGMITVIAWEMAIARPGIGAQEVLRLARIDTAYGILALIVLAVGFARAIFAAKGWDYYSGNGFFHAKLGAFVAAGVLSIWPTMAFIRWRRALKDNPAALPAEGEVRRVRLFIHLELGLIALMLVFAAAMARG